MAGAYIGGANLEGAIFEPHSLPVARSLFNVEGLDTLSYWVSPQSIAILRQLLKDNGLRNQERQVNYALNHQQRLSLMYREVAALRR